MEGRVLKPMPAELRMKMDALVQDLTQALEETSCSSSVRMKVGGFRRRARSTGNIALIAHRTTHSDDSISERIHSKGKELSSFVQSDSDEVSANSQRRLIPYPLQKRSSTLQQTSLTFESDSVNENSSPLRAGTRRKRKMKRMDVDSEQMALPRVLPPAFITRSCIPIPGPSGVRNNTAKKKKVLKAPLISNSLKFDTVIGKRKRSTREKASDFDMEAAMSRSTKLGRLERLARLDDMELDKEMMSSSSLSSSESDAGVYTNDEGREGDDEQSDWFGEQRWDDDTDLEQDDSTLQTIFNGSLDQINTDARQAYKERIEWLREGLMDREIRGGRRRIRSDRPGFAVLTSANEKLSKFLQDCDQSTLRLHPMELEERQQLSCLINLYSLHMRLEQSDSGQPCPVISKTSKTPQTTRIDAAVINMSEYKKRRKGPLPQPHVGEAASNQGSEDMEQLMATSWDPSVNAMQH